MLTTDDMFVTLYTYIYITATKHCTQFESSDKNGGFQWTTAVINNLSLNSKCIPNLKIRRGSKCIFQYMLTKVEIV